MKILLIEDNEMIIKALKYLLESHEYMLMLQLLLKKQKKKLQIHMI